MVTGPSYQRLGNHGDAGGLIFKYKLAKALTIVSLVAVVMMAIGSLIYPQSPHNTVHEESVSSSASPYGGMEDLSAPPAPPVDGHCRLPSALTIPQSEDGTYTPPGPDATLLNAIKKAGVADRDSYCRNVYDSKYGFSDVIPYDHNGECGAWQAQYRALHEKRLKQLRELKETGQFSPSDPPLFTSYLCKEVATVGNRGCGGLADRMSGMISTFFFALLTDRAYLAHWADENPIPLEILFEKPNIDWSYEPQEMRSLFDKTDGLTFQAVDTLNQKYPSLGEIIFRDGPMQDFNDLWNGSYVEIRSNRAYIIRVFEESKLYPAKLAQLGLTKANAHGCLTDFLFRPTLGSRRFINAYRNLFEMDSVLSIGMQVRTDDNALANPQDDANSLEKWNYFLTCANQLAQVQRKPHHQRIVYFMVTDSVRLRDEFKSLNEDTALAKKYLGQHYMDTSTVVTGLPVEHIEPDQVAKYINVTIPVEVTRARMTPGVNSAVIENWLLGNTDFRLISPQGYGKLAAFHSRSENSTIALPRANRKHTAPDCSKPGAFTTFHWLSTQWSLG